MSQMQFDAAIEKIVSALKTAGYDPWMQLRGYAETGEATFITRQNGARELIADLKIEDIQNYLKAYNKI